MRNYNNQKYILFISLALLITVAFSSSLSFGATLVYEDFTRTEIRIGERITVGDNLFGWIGRYEKGNALAGNEAVVLPLDGSLFNDSGSVSFLVKRHRISTKGSYRKQSAFNSVIWFLDEKGEELLGLYVIWKDDFKKPSQTVIDTTGNLNLWGTVPAGRIVQLGDWTHFIATWDAVTGQSDLFVNGISMIDKSNFFPFNEDRLEWTKTMALAFSAVREVRIGADLTGSDPSYEALIAEVRVDDIALTPRQANTLFRDTYRKYGLLPNIKSVTHDAFQAAGYSGKLVKGDTFAVTLKAEPGGSATFDLVQPESVSNGVTTPEKIRIAGHAMTEDPDNPGTYTGTHSVQYGEDVEDGQVVGHFADSKGILADPAAALHPVTVDTKVYMDVNSSNDLIPADEESKAGITIVAKDANDKPVRDHELLLTMSTTDEYTGTLGGGTFEDMVGGEIDVDWGGVTDSFGEVTAQYQSGFAAKTILVSAKDMVSGDVGVGYVRSYITGTVDVLVKKPQAVALSLAGSMDVSVSREWLTADGRSRSRITAVVKDRDSKPVEGHNIQFTLHGNNGKIRTIKSWTDSRGRAFADYIAGTVIGEVQIEVRDLTGGHVAVVSIQLRSDAPAEIALTAEPGEVFTDNAIGSVITAKVTDANGNPNFNTDVLFEVASGGGTMSADSAVTDEKDGIASVSFFPGSEPGLSTIKATVMSRAPTDEEVAAAKGAVFLYGLADDPGRLEVIEWYAKPDDEVTEGQDLVKLEDRRGTFYTVVSPRDGVLATFVAEERDRVVYGQTLGYVLPVPE